MVERLGKQDWIDAGLEALAGGGIGAVRVERLAEELSVTKGSFYWHFTDRATLHEALLETWRRRATENVIVKVQEFEGDAKARLRLLFTIVLESDGRLDMAIRAWAVKDSAALAALKHIDKCRVAYLESLFCQLGFTPTQATARAWFIYNALIGHFAMGVPFKAQGQGARQFESIFEMLVGGRAR